MSDNRTNLLRAIWCRIRSLVQRRAAKQEIDDEMRFHIEQLTGENIAAGMSPQDAARDARRRFGNFQTAREQCREVRGAAFGETVLQDIRFGARLLRKNPGFTTVVLLTLALGIGAVAAVFTIVQGVLLKPTPYPKPEQIVVISSVRTTGELYSKGTAAAQWREWRDQAKSFTAMAAYAWWWEYIVSPDSNERVSGLGVTADFFKVLGVQPQIGRAFQPSDFPSPEATSTSVAILGYELWQRRFHGDSNIIGRVVSFNLSGPLTIIGVMPPDLRMLPSVLGSHLPGFDANDQVELWTPNSGSPKAFGTKAPYWSVIGRLGGGIGLAAAQAELTAITARQSRDDSTFEGITAKAELLTDIVNGQARRLLVPLSGAAVLVFLIACGSVAGLLLARGFQRQREYAVRCALGAGRWRLARQSLAESLPLAVSGGVFGAALTVVTVKVMKATGGSAIPRLDAVTIGWPTLAVCLAASVVAATIAGLTPALRASRLDAAAAAKGGAWTSANRTDRKLLSGVAMAQTALTLVLLVAAGLLLRTVAKLAQVRTGYDTDRIVSMTVVELWHAQRPDVANDTENWGRRAMDFHHRALSQVSALPCVKSAAWAWGIPLTGNEFPAAIQMEGSVKSEKFKDEIEVPLRTVTPEYFDTVGMRVVAGGNFRPADTNTFYQAIINQAMADKYFPNRDPVGKRFRFGFRNSGAGINPHFSDAEIRGVVANSTDAALTMNSEPEFYISFWAIPTVFRSLVVRATGDPRSVVASAQQALRSVDPTVAIEDVKTFEQIRHESIAPQLFTVRLLTGFSAVAGALALIGVYGVLSLSVASRRQEMAIRMAVGAPRRNVFRLIFGEGLRLVGIGIAIGTIVSLVSTKVLRFLLFGVEPSDPLTFAVMVPLFILMAALACYFPARRATQIEAIEALRCE